MDRPASRLIEPGLHRIYRQGQSRYRRVARGRGDQVRAMHEWRKRVKDLRYAAEMLERRPTREQGASGARHGRGSRRAQDARLRRLARAADELGEVLGEDHDLAVLAAMLRKRQKRGPVARARVGPGTRRTLLKLIERRRRELRGRALRAGERLYRKRPKRFLRDIRAAYTREVLEVSRG